MTTCIAVHCPHCHSDQMVKRGTTDRGTPRSLCQHTTWALGSFLLDSRNQGCLPEVKQLIIAMSLHASGIRDTARSLRISTDTVLSELKKKAAGLESVHTALLRTLDPDEVTVDIERAGEAEMDAMWSLAVACWSIADADQSVFSIALERARGAGQPQRYDRHAPRLHHLAFHVDNRADVD